MNDYEPSAVKVLRAMIARGASVPSLQRIAGSVAEYDRLVARYGLLGNRPVKTDEAAAASAPPLDRRSDEPLPRRQAALLGEVTHLAALGRTFPGSKQLAVAMDCSWLVVERDLRRLVQLKLIRMEPFRAAGGGEIQRVSIAGTRLQTALPIGAVSMGKELDGANAVRAGA